MPKTPHRLRKTWLILAALILLSLILFAIQQSQKKDAAQSESKPKRITPSATRHSSKSTHLKIQRTTTRDLPTNHSTEDLSSFFLLPTDLSQVTLEEAMDSLLAHYRNICRETAEGPIKFHYTIHGEPDPIFYLKLGGDFISNLKFIAAMAGMNLEIDNDQLIFTEVKDGPPVQRRWTVPPTFSSSIPELTHLGIPIDTVDDPFGSSPDIRERLLRLGVIQEGDPVLFLTSSSTLILRTGAKNHVKIDGLVSKSISNTPYQTLIKFPDDSGTNFGMLVPPGGLGLLQKSGASIGSSSDIRFLVVSFERGFGREIQAVSFAGDLPSDEAQALFLQTGNAGDLGIRENLSHSTFNITRESYEKENHSFTFKGQDCVDHQMPFTSERIDASGRQIEIPPLKAE